MRLGAMAVAAAMMMVPVAARAGAAEELGEAYRAYDDGDLDLAAELLEQLDATKLVNDDYFYWLRGHVALLRGEPKTARAAFQTLAKQKGSRLAAEVPWRLADCAWELGDHAGAAAAYAKLLPGADGAHADLAVVRLRIAQAAKGKARKSKLRDVLLEHPAHPAAVIAEQELGGATLSGDDRITRAQNLVVQHLWHESVAELMRVPDDAPASTLRRRTYWLGETLFKMRRRYGDAGEMLLSVYEDMDSAEAMFHGARALSRADRDDEAIVWYRKVVATYPKTDFAAEAQYLTGWLEFNRGNYEAAIAPLQGVLDKYPKSKWTDDALWFMGMSRYLLGKLDEAKPEFERLAKHGGELEGGKGKYWLARTLDQTGDGDGAAATYASIIERWPFTWYALLARARLAEKGVAVGPFGKDTPKAAGPKIATKVDESLATDATIEGVDELLAAGLTVEAGEELERGEKGFLGRHDRADALAMLMDRYAKADSHHRPMRLAEAIGGAALDTPAEGSARVWWTYAFPQAYAPLVEKYQDLGDNPDYYLYSIMRKESAFNPHDLSYADAQGLLQMIPATTARVAKVLGEPYDAGRLYDPEFNVQTGAWYIGHLLAKFKGQIPIGAGSFNSGPRPVMKWLDKNGDRPIDELVELVSYTQTREYMKKVTGNYARYVYLYDGKIYEQPLTVDKAYVVDDLTY